MLNIHGSGRRLFSYFPCVVTVCPVSPKSKVGNPSSDPKGDYAGQYPLLEQSDQRFFGKYLQDSTIFTYFDIRY